MTTPEQRKQQARLRQMGAEIQWPAQTNNERVSISHYEWQHLSRDSNECTCIYRKREENEQRQKHIAMDAENGNT